MANTVIFFMPDIPIPVAKKLSPVFLNVSIVPVQDALTDTFGIPLTDRTGSQLTDVFVPSLPFSRSAGVALQAWSQPLVAVPLFGSPTTGASIDNPPFLREVQRGQIQVRVASIAQQDAFDCQFIAVALPRRLVSLSVAAAAMLGASLPDVPWWYWWVEADQSPQLRVKLPQGPPPAVVKLQDYFGLDVILPAWGAVDTFLTPREQLSPSLLNVRIDAPLPRRASLDTAAWAPSDQAVQPAIRLVPQPVATPFIASVDNARQDILDGWLLIDASPITARSLNPAFKDARIDRPIVRRDSDQDSVSTAWLPVDSAPILPRALPKVSAAASVDNPPLQKWRGVELAWNTPVPVPLYSFSALPNGAVNADNPPLCGPPADSPVLVSIVATWVSELAQAAAIIPPTSGTLFDFPFWFISGDSFPSTVIAESILYSWVSPDSQIFLSRHPPVTSVRVDAPLPKRALIDTAAWAPSDQAVQPAVRVVPQPVAAVPFIASVDNARQDILDGWLPVDSAPVVARSLNPKFEDVQVDRPTVKRDFDQDSILATWIPLDPAPTLTVKMPQGITAAFIITTTLRARQEILGAWVPLDPAPITTRPLNPVFEAVRVDNPPSRSVALASSVTIGMATWTLADPLLVVPKYLPQGTVIVSAPLPFCASSTAAGILASWTTTGAQIFPPRLIPQAAPAQFVPVRQTSLVGIVSTWADLSPTIEYAASPRISASIDSPPTASTQSDNFAAVLTTWTPSTFDPWYTAVSGSQGILPPPFVAPLSIEAFSSPFELNSTLRAGLGSLSGG
jgi:hypothetical protein